MMTEKMRVSASSVISSVAETSAIAGEVACGRWRPRSLSSAGESVAFTSG